jgi:DNA-binding LacI/PurR family transcriptional regulator
VDGVILVQSYVGVEQAKSWLKNLRCVHVDPAYPELTPFVSAHRHRSMHLLVEHLVGLGHRSFAALGFSKKHPWRWRGFTDALQFHGIDPERKLQAIELPAPGRESFAEGTELARMALSAKEPPTAWLAVNDHVAMGAVQHVRDSGLSVPEDFSIAGFDNLEIGQYLHPTLTSIDQRVSEMMRCAVDLLMQQINGPGGRPIAGNKTIEPQLLIRESTGPARKPRKNRDR